MPVKEYRTFSLGRHTSRHKTKKSVVKKASKRRAKKVQTLIMKEGTMLFHGHAEAKEWSVPHNRPAFFGGSFVAMYYAGDKPNYVSSYVLVKKVKLLDLGNKKNYGSFFKTLNKIDKSVFSRVTGYGISDLDVEDCKYKKKSKSDIRFCTEGFFDMADEKKDTYAMLRFAMLICEHGFDGYYIPPIHKRAYKGENLTEQIILCKPKDKVLKVNQLSIKSMMSNMAKKKRKSSRKR